VKEKKEKKEQEEEKETESINYNRIGNICVRKKFKTVFRNLCNPSIKIDSAVITKKVKRNRLNCGNKLLYW
jgi:hypothetical protein